MAKKKEATEVLSVPTQVQEQMVVESAEAQDVLTMVQKFEIVKQEDMDFANECLGEVKGKLKALEKMRKEATDPLNKALTTIRGWFKPAEKFYEQSEDVWKKKIGAFCLVQAQLQTEAMQKVEEAHAQSDVRGVAQALSVATQAEVTLPQNVSIIEKWDFEITDAAKIPFEFYSIDPSKIDVVVKSQKGSTQIPGVRVFRNDTVVRRS